MTRAGFALIGALIAVVFLGALIVGAFVATTEETRISGNVRIGQLALYSAESAVERDVAGWAVGETDSIGIAQSVSHTAGGGLIEVTTTLVRLDSTLYWVVAQATDGSVSGNSTPSVRRRIGLLVRRVSDSAGRPGLLRVGERAWSELF